MSIFNFTSMAFIHHVYFWLKNPDNKEEQEALIAGLKKLAPVESLRFLQIGIPAPTDRPVIDRTYHASLLCVFDDQEGHDIYQEHPLHRDFVKECSALWEKVLIYDSTDA